jgi:hypothetical protein
LVVLSINSGSWGGGVMFFRLAKKFGKLVRVALKGEVGSGVGEWGKQCGATGFCGPCACLCVFLL